MAQSMVRRLLVLLFLLPIVVSAETSLLLHFNDASAASRINAGDPPLYYTDSSYHGRTVENVWGYKIPKMWPQGEYDYQNIPEESRAGLGTCVQMLSAYIPDAADYQFATRSWTIDFWLKPPATYTYENSDFSSTILFAGWTITTGDIGALPFSYGPVFIKEYNGAVTVGVASVPYLEYDPNVPSWQVPSPTQAWMFYGQIGTVTVDVWSHIAVTRNGSNFYTFVDGNEGPSFTSADPLFIVRDPMRIGFRTPCVESNTPLDTFGYSGCIDEFRITMDEARWVATFTPPGEMGLLGYIPVPHGGVSFASGPARINFSGNGSVKFGK